MTAHELAKKLLEGPDLPVYVGDAWGEPDYRFHGFEVLPAEEGYEERVVIYS